MHARVLPSLDLSATQLPSLVPVPHYPPLDILQYVDQQHVAPPMNLLFFL